MDNGQKVKKDYIRRAKGLLLQCKRITFGGQKDSFYNAKGLHLEGKRTTFEKEKDFATSRGNNRYLAREQKKARNQTVSGANYIVCISRAERACCQNRARQ